MNKRVRKQGQQQKNRFYKLKKVIKHPTLIIKIILRVIIVGNKYYKIIKKKILMKSQQQQY